MSNLSRQEEGKVQLDIGICTYRRNELEDTLRSVAGLKVPPGVAVKVIVADNDATPSARKLVEGLRADVPFEILYVHCPESNISIARNACLDNGAGDFLAYLDDDATCSAEWLSELLGTAKETGADAVLGPVRAFYSDGAPDWVKQGDFHSTRPVWVRGEIRTGYTGNVLLRRASSCVWGHRFNSTLGRSGGEDTEYFTRLREAGGRIAYAPEAWVFEPVPDSRARFSWLAKRRFRVGQTHGRLVGERAAGIAKVGSVGLAVVKAAYCFALAAFTVFSPSHRNRHLLRGVMHAGVASGLIGIREIQLYGQLGSSAP
jgi:succinoglycan biosynthesis protein ExoM